MGQHLSYPGNVITGTLNSIINASGTPTFQVTGWPGTVGVVGQPFVVEVGPGLGDDEKILVSAFSAGVATVSARGWDSTSSVAHAVGEQVKVVWDATSAQDFSDHLYLPGRDDHTQYLTVTRHDTPARHGSTVVTHGLIGSLSADDHTQYYNQARHDAHPHPATTLATGPGVITRAMLAPAAQGLMIGQLVARPGGITGSETSFLLPADGTAVSRTTWPALFTQIGVIYGAGNGSTTFNVPDCRDRMVIGSSVSAPDGVRSARPEASTGGEETHLLVTGEVPAHTHSVTDSGHGHAIGDPGHSHSGIQGSGIGGTDGGWMVVRDDGSTLGLSSSAIGLKATAITPGGVGTNAVATGAFAVAGNASVSAGNSGGGGAHQNMPPFIAVPVFIVAA